MADDFAMDDGGFDLASLLGGLDGPVMPAPALPQAPPTQPKGGMRSLAPLLMALPAILKGGGQAGAAAFLAGIQQAQQRGLQAGQLDFQNQRLLASDARANAQAQSIDAYRRQQAAQQRAQAQQGLFRDATTAFEAADSPEAIDALMGLFQARAQGLGVSDLSPLTKAVEVYKAPSRMQRKAAQRMVDRMVKEHGVDWASKVQNDPAKPPSFTLDGAPIDPVTGRPQQTSLQDLLGLTGLNVAGVPQKPANPRPPAALGSFEDYVTRKFGENPTAAQIEEARKLYGRADDRPPSVGIGSTILVQTVDSNGNPVQRIVPRTAGSEFPTQPSGSQQAALAEQEAGLANVADVERLFKPEFVGPVMGRKTRAQMAIPGVPDVDEGVAEFYAATAGLRNEIIKLMSGAAVSGSEENRMKAQLPDVTDKPSVFKAKLAQTKRNRETLLNRMKAKTGQPQSGGGASVGGVFMHPQYGRVRVVGMNPDGTARVEKVVGQ